MTTVPRPDTSFSTDTFVEAMSPENAGAALTADPSTVTGGAGVQATVQAAQQERAAPLRAAQADEQMSFGEKAKAAWQETDTAWILEAISNEFKEGGYEYDPNFDPNREWTNVVQQYGIQNNADNQAAIGEAANADEMHDIADRISQHEQNQEMLSRNGAWAITSGVVDPVYFIADAATFGLSRGFKLGRAAAGALGATGTVGVMGAADVGGKDKSGFDYVLGAALTGGVYSLFAGDVANQIHRGERTAFGRVRQPNKQGGVASKVNEFLSEYDKLTPNDASRNIINRVADDPVRRGEFNTDSAASYLRGYRNEVDGLHDAYYKRLDQALARQGYGKVQRNVDYNGKFGEARDTLERNVAEELLRRDDHWRRYGTELPPSRDPDVAELVKLHENMTNRTAQIAREAGLEGFQDFTPRPGYFHRSWNPQSIVKAEQQYGTQAIRGLLRDSALRGLKTTSEEEANAIADAIIQRAKAKLRDESLDFVGSFGKGTNAQMREMLEAANIAPERVQSIMNKFEQNTAEAGQIKFAKDRLDLDMSAAMHLPDGGTLRMVDLIDMDLARLGENYTQQITGRAALARAGVGGADADIRNLRAQYAESLVDLSRAERDDRLRQFDGLISDFTGIRPQQNILSPFAQRFSSLASSTMLGASGLWQAAEYATLAYRYGAIETAGEFMRRFPGVKRTLDAANKNPDLADEMRTVLGVDLARDVRVRPWLRQHEVNLASKDTAMDRLLHAGKQFVPYLNGMKYIHANQARLNANLALNTLGKAANGDRRALKQLGEYGLKGEDWEIVKAAIQSNARRSERGNIQEMGWGGFNQRERELAMNTALRMMDDTLLYGRPGEGSSFARSQLGQVLGQFRSFVSFAHNKQLRGTLQRGGIGGYGLLLAYQYPLTLLMYSTNEAIKGDLDISSQAKVSELMLGSLGYTAAIGFAGDAAGILGITGRGGLSVPLTGLFNAPSRALGGASKLFQGEYQAGGASIAEAAASVTPFVNVFPATKLALDAMKPDE